MIVVSRDSVTLISKVDYYLCKKILDHNSNNHWGRCCGIEGKSGKINGYYKEGGSWYRIENV